MDTLLQLAWLLRECTRPLDVPFKQTSKPSCLLGHKLSRQICPIARCWGLGFLRSQREWEKLVISSKAAEGGRCGCCFRQRWSSEAGWKQERLQITWSSCSWPVACVEAVYSFIQNTGFENGSRKSGCFWCFNLCCSSWPSFLLADVDKSCILAGKEGLVLMSIRTRASPMRLLLRRCRAEGGQTVAVREQLLPWIRFANVMS